MENGIWKDNKHWNRYLTAKLLQSGLTPKDIVTIYPTIWEITDNGKLKQKENDHWMIDIQNISNDPIEI